MITQSNHNTLIERVKILTQLNGLDKTPDILCDVQDFLYKLKSFDEYESMSMPTHVYADCYQNSITFEWTKDTPKGEDLLSISFLGQQEIAVEAHYPSLDIKVNSPFPLNEDMANFVTTHLEIFKQPLKKRRYR